MKYLRILTMWLPLLLTACEKVDRDTPDCIVDLIRHHKDELALCSTGASAALYTFQGQNVYVFDPGRCGADMGAYIYSENCEKLGMLGGIAGNLIINNARFDQEAVFIKTIWED
jgi:hypothetical protein